MAEVFGIVINHWMVQENEARKKLYYTKQKEACQKAIFYKRRLKILNELVSNVLNHSPDINWATRRDSLYCLLFNINDMDQKGFSGGVCPDCESGILYAEPNDPDYTICCYECSYVFFSVPMIRP